MKNNTKLIMENWRKFLKEGPDDESSYYSPASEEPPEGFQHDAYNDGGFNPDDSGIESFEPDVDDLGPEGEEAMVPPSDEDLEGEMARDSSARDAWQGSEGAYADAIEAGGSDDDALAAAEEYWDESGYDMDSDADVDIDEDESFDD